jgi:hypothetical protein
MYYRLISVFGLGKMCRFADDPPKLRRLGTAEQAIAESFRDGLTCDLGSMRR